MTIKDLDYHATVLDILETGKDSVMVIHGGGVYGEKEKSMLRWCINYLDLPDKIKNRLVLENCEKSYSIKDCLQIHKETGVPIVFDTHHFECYKQLHPDEEFEPPEYYIPLILDTWKKKNIKPKFHISEQGDGKIGKHSDYIEIIPEYLLEIPEKYGVHIDIIDGQEEAAIIASTDLSDYIKADKTYLYVDVGGGSTEFTLFHDQKRIVSKSFKIGTVRLLNNMVSETQWDEAKQWVKHHTLNYDKIRLIGSGGNINKIFKLSNTSEGKPLSYLYLIKFYENLKTYTYEERITVLNLNQDRADVILPASQIYLSAMKWSKAKHIYVPKIGLSDGIIKSIYYNNIKSKEL